MSKRRKEPRWLSRLVVDAIHTDQLREHGGLPGVRDETALESALARPRQRWHYGQAVDLSTVAAAYAFGLVKNHPYRDGNKRIGFLAMATFLGLNGFEFEAPEAEVVTRIVTLAAGQLTEEQLAVWIRSASSESLNSVRSARSATARPRRGSQSEGGPSLGSHHSIEPHG